MNERALRIAAPLWIGILFLLGWEALVWAIEAAALNPEIEEFKTGVLQT